MTEVADPRGVHDLPGWVRRSWLVPLVLGIVLAVVGVILLLNIGAGVRTLRWLVVVALVFSAAEAFATAPLRRRAWLGWLAGALCLIGALVGVVWPLVTLRALALVLGIFLVVAGGVRIGVSWAARSTTQGWGWSFFLGILSTVAGLVFLFGNPVISVLVLAVVLACYMIFSGVTLLTLSLAVRRIG
jgi:uncharacterized membrane protein HdeD (DUF308 family)